jgi:hypothetical protein
LKANDQPSTDELRKLLYSRYGGTPETAFLLTAGDRLKELEGALRELVRLKDLKDGMERADEASPHGAVPIADAQREYQRRKPLAWEAARAALRTTE